MTKLEQLKKEMDKAWANVDAWAKALAEDRANVEARDTATARATAEVEAWAWAKYEKVKQAYETELSKESK